LSDHKGVVEVEYDNESMSFRDRNSFQSRNAAMIGLIRKAWLSRVKDDARSMPKRSFSLYTDDCFGDHCDYSFAARGAEDVPRCMPNFVFDSWPECGIDSYEEVFGQVVSAGRIPPEDDRAFWVGNISCPLKGYDSRRMGLSVASRHPDMFDFRSVEWSSDSKNAKGSVGYVSLPDHCRYRVLIDFGGLGFSARIPLLLASGRPVVLVGHPQEAWFYWDESLVPWVHYIPCGSKDGSDVGEEKIREALSWTFDNRDACSEIGARGREYAERNLTHSAAVERIGSMLLAHSADGS
jgi:hypothetical protein